MQANCDLACVFTGPYQAEYWESIGFTPLFTYSDKRTFKQYIDSVIDHQKPSVPMDYQGMLY